MSYKNILVPVDDSPISYAAIEHAEALAKAFGSKITVMSVLSVDPLRSIDFYKVAPAITDYVLEAEQNAQGRLNDIQLSFQNHGLEVKTLIIRSVPPATGILNIAEEIHADLIVMGSHGRKGFRKFILGSVAQEVLSLSHIPVLIVKTAV
ncbi:universal stress protein [Acinetobacter sp. 187]|uniref:Universal stress protein n=1 Tax=Acinetobacter lanii TaxID=2715163 RepID=A0A6G8S435_9GAMM|nr:universal stress protein [Acinetobacter lanii]NHC04073.1 universal stress protein [Acinetobacter lanii]QIO08850.1 universal stress protein [Acinetobacter lanii]